MSCTSYRVLVVDDNADAAEMLSIMLELHGHKVASALDGVQALEVARQLVPDVVLLDIGMPRLDGFEVCRRLRDTELGRHMYIVALTGWAGENEREAALAAGFDAYLAKPADVDTIIDTIRECADANAQARMAGFGD